MSTSMKDLSPKTLAAIAATALLAGCNLTGAMNPPDPFPTGSAPATAYTPTSAAGLPVTQDPDGTKLGKLVAQRSSAGAFGKARSDPFALTGSERQFETLQAAERVFGSGSGFTNQLSAKPEVELQVTPPEPQPYRRLSGIVVGDSILAILEEQGREPVIVTPGSQIPNSEWRVVSIDQDKAVLRRSGNRKPNQIIVRLETPRFGTPGGGQPGGGVPGGFPGGAPGGFPGGRGGPGGPGGPSGDGGDF